MIKIVRKGRESSTKECEECQSLIEYDYGDCLNKEDLFSVSNYIICPVCGEEIVVWKMWNVKGIEMKLGTMI